MKATDRRLKALEKQGRSFAEVSHIISMVGYPPEEARQRIDERLDTIKRSGMFEPLLILDL